MTEPTDAEILALNAGEIHFSESPTKYPWAGHGTQYHAGAPGVLSFARAVLAKWGTPPAVAGEPVAWYEYNAGLDAWFLAYSHNPKAKTRPLVFGDATPQPTQAQAGAVPLPKSYQGSTLTSNSHDAGCRVSFSFSSVAEAEAWHESIVDQRHGIKGGQHD